MMSPKKISALLLSQLHVYTTNYKIIFAAFSKLQLSLGDNKGRLVWSIWGSNLPSTNTSYFVATLFSYLWWWIHILVSECEGCVGLQLFEDVFPQCGEELLGFFCTWGEILEVEQKKNHFISVRKMTLRQFFYGSVFIYSALYID